MEIEQLAQTKLCRLLRVYRNEFLQQFLPLEYLNVYQLTVLFIQYFTYACYLLNQAAATQG